jgi:hypothetical protein
LAIATSTGLAVVSGALALLFADHSIVGSTNGIRVQELSTGGISTGANGIGLFLDPNGALSTGATGAGVRVDGTTIKIVGDNLVASVTPPSPLIAADASILVSTSTGSTTIRVQESSTGGISTGPTGIGIKLSGTTLVESSSGLAVGVLTSTNLPGDIAYTDVANVFTKDQTIIGTDSSPLTVENFGQAFCALFFNNGAGFQTSLLFQQAGVSRWQVGSDFFANGTQTFYIFDQTNIVTKMFINNQNVYLGGNAQAAPVVAILNSGNVGIGIPVPLFALDVAGTVNAPHFKGSSTTPGIAAGAGAGTGPTIALVGTDTAGKITLTSGTLPAISAVILTVTFASAYGTTPYVVFSPGNGAAASLSALSAIYVTATTTTFVFNSDTTAITAATQYIWTYHVIG